MLTEPRREPPGQRRLGFRPGARLPHDADAAFRGMIHPMEERGIGEVRILHQRFQRVRHHAGDVVLLQQLQPFGVGAGFHLCRDHVVQRVDVRRPGTDIGKTRIVFEQMAFADAFEKPFPLPVVVRQHGNEPVLAGIGPAAARQRAGVAGGAGGRIEGLPLHVFGQHELRHRLEHRDLDHLADAGTRLRQQPGQQRIRRRTADNPVDRRHRDKPRLPGGALQ